MAKSGEEYEILVKEVYEILTTSSRFAWRPQLYD